MPPVVPRRSFFRLVPLLLALAPAGCGLADYENKMEAVDARLKRFDDENKLLGDPLFVQAGDADSRVMVFLRPPRGIPDQPDDPKETPLHYHPKNPAPDAACTDLFLWIGARDEDLKADVKKWLTPAEGAWQSYNAQPPNGRLPLAFESAQFTLANAPAYRVYVHQAPSGIPVAVVFKTAQPTPTADAAILMSLETYTDTEAAKARDEYGKRRGH